MDSNAGREPERGGRGSEIGSSSSYSLKGSGWIFQSRKCRSACTLAGECFVRS